MTELPPARTAVPDKRLTLVRHGQSSSNAGGISMANHRIPLTPLGQQQARQVAQWLPAQAPAVYVSPFLRARQTAQPYLQRTGLQAHVLGAFHEFEMIDLALLAGLSGAQRRPLSQQYWADADPDRRMGAQAETFREFHQRVQHFAGHILPRLPDGAVLFGHGTWMAMLCWQTLGFVQADRVAMRQFADFKQVLPVPNGAMYYLECRNGHWTARADQPRLRELVQA